jgi:hypothetical protein
LGQAMPSYGREKGAKPGTAKRREDRTQNGETLCD